MKKKGLFITFEGPEGGGKSTQVKLLKTWLELRNLDHIISREPGGTKISEQIRNVLLNPENKEMTSLTEFLLYSASRSQHTEEKILPYLEKKYFVISDRYFFASLAYQGYGRGLDINLINKITKIATFGLIPDIIFVLDINPEIGLKKAKRQTEMDAEQANGDRLENEDISFHQKVRNGYLELSKKYDNVVLIKSGLTIEKVHKIIIKNIERKINESL